MPVILCSRDGSLIFYILQYVDPLCLWSNEHRVSRQFRVVLECTLSLTFTRNPYSVVPSSRHPCSAHRRPKPCHCQGRRPVSRDCLPSAVPPAVREAFWALRVPEFTSRYRCTNRSNPAAWNTLSNCKARILDMVWSSTASAGVKFSAVKFLQRVILVQTRSVSDPRVL